MALSEQQQENLNNYLNAKKYLDHSFICPKCSETLFTKIYYYDESRDPYVKFSCPQKHGGNLDIKLFFSIFDTANKELENELSKFDEDLQKDIENYKLKMENKSKIFDNKKENEESNSKITNINLINVDNQSEPKTPKNQINKKNYFKNLSQCEKFQIILSNKDILSEFKNINSKRILSEKMKIHQLLNNSHLKSKSNSIIRHHHSNSEKQFKIEKYYCDTHKKLKCIGYCFKCKKNICKKCLKGKHNGHSYKAFKKMKLLDDDYKKLNKKISYCAELLLKFEKESKFLIENITNKNERNILIKMINAFCEINKETLDSIKSIIKTYNTCVQQKIFDYDVINNVTNIKLNINLNIPRNISEINKILLDYKQYCFSNNLSNNSMQKKYAILFDVFKEYSQTENPSKEIKKKFDKIFNDGKYDELLEEGEEIIDLEGYGIINFKNLNENIDSDINKDDENEVSIAQKKFLEEQEKFCYENEEFDLNNIEEMGDYTYEEEEDEFGEDYDDYGEYGDINEDDDIGNDEKE